MSDINRRVDAIVDKFNTFKDWEDRYRELIQFGKKATNLDIDSLDDKFLVKGCQSQVWLIPDYKSGIVSFKGTSDAAIVKGIVCLLIEAFSGSNPQEILDFDVDFLNKIGITEHLSMNRTNGLASMVKQIKMYALVYNSLFQKGVMDAP